MEADRGDADVFAQRHELRECRLVFFVGFLGLPWLWFVNWLQYRGRVPPESDPMVQVYARRSLVGSLVGLALFLGYFAIVQTTWRGWARGIMLNAPQNHDEF